MLQKEKEQELLSRLSGEHKIWNRQSLWFYYSPFLISSFLSEFSKVIEPKNILDPTAWLWSSLRIISDSLNNKTNITAIEINQQNLEIAKERSTNFPINYILWDSLEILSKIEEKFDFITWDLPWWIKVDKRYYNLNLELDTIILLMSLDKLKDWWFAIFTNPDKFFLSEYDKIKDIIKEKWISLVWSIKLPACTYYPQTWIQANIIIFQKINKIDKVFLWELTENNLSKLIKNFFEKNWSSDLIGKFINENENEKFLRDRKKSYEKIDKLLTQKKIEVMDKCIISTNVNFEDENAVFVTTFGFPKIKLKFNNDEIEKIKEKKSKYFQIILPKKYDPNIFKNFYNSSFWKLYFGRLVTWIMSNLNLLTIKEAELYYPTKIYLEKIQKTFEKMESIKNIMSDVDDTLKVDFFSIDQVYETISKINIMSDIDYTIEGFPTLIAKQYKELINSKEEGEYQNALEIINNIFITTGVFCISVMLWWLSWSVDFMSEISDDLTGSVRDFTKLGLGDIYCLYWNIAKKIKTKSDDDDGGKDFLKSLFSLDDIAILNKLTNKEIYILIDEFSKLRNKYIWHKGKLDETIYKEILIEAEALLNKFILKLSCLKEIKVILWSNKINRIDEYEYEVVVTIFNWYSPYSERLILLEAPIWGKLYFTIWLNKKIISLPELIRYDTSTENQAKISYIYNRVDKWNIEYVTYEIAEKERKKYYISDIKNPILQKLLSKPD